MGAWAEVWRAFWCIGPGEKVGFGQSWADDMRFLYRFRKCWTKGVVWRQPTDDERQRYDAHPIISDFGDFTEGVTEVDGRFWVARSRAFWGWPDPPQWVLFVVDADGGVWCAADFNQWPQGWKRPEPEKTESLDRSAG